MLYFANPKYLYLLLLVPLFVISYIITNYLRKRGIKKLGDKDLVEQLMPSFSETKMWLKVVIFTLGFASFIIGISRPQIGAKLKEKKIKGIEIMIALDVSNSMLAEDYSPNRLERAKLAISRLTDKLRDDRIGLVIFAGSAFTQLPITNDYVSAKMFLKSINTESVPQQGTDLGSALKHSMLSFSKQGDYGKAIILVSDGEDHQKEAIDMAKIAAEQGIKVYTIGIGLAEGVPIPKDGELMKDSKGNIVVTKLNEQILSEIATTANGAYIKATKTEFGFDPIIKDLRTLQEEEFNTVVFEEYDEQYMYFFAIALFLLIIEMLLGYRKCKRSLFN